jgi:hypothetical protein
MSHRTNTIVASQTCNSSEHGKAGPVVWRRTNLKVIEHFLVAREHSSMLDPLRNFYSTAPTYKEPKNHVRTCDTTQMDHCSRQIDWQPTAMFFDVRDNKDQPRQAALQTTGKSNITINNLSHQERAEVVRSAERTAFVIHIMP